jgi:hypothetical protein
MPEGGKCERPKAAEGGYRKEAEGGYRKAAKVAEGEYASVFDGEVLYGNDVFVPSVPSFHYCF